ncbi:MAG: hypothetical protein ACYC6F_01510 [Longimicrobiales bacterium]
MAGEPAGLVRLQAAVVLAVVVLAHGSLAPFVADADSFYHLGHAAHYAANGLFDTAFPWATTSAIGDLGGDLWWGFHLVLIPFTEFGSVTDGIRAAALLLTLALAAVVWWVLRRHQVPGAGWWTALFLVAVPNVLFRYLMVRPHVLSLALALLLLSLLVRGRAWQALSVSAAITWLHLGLFWMAPGIVAAYALSHLMTRRGYRNGGDLANQEDHRDPGVPVPAALAAVLAGTFLGALLRPHPLATIELAWIQIARLFAEKATDRPLIFASELLPLPVPELLRSAWSFLLVWLAAGLVASWWRRAPRPSDRPEPQMPERRLTAASSLVAVAFLLVTVLSARRALVEFTAFGFLLLPLAWTHLVPAGARRRVAPALALLLVAHLAWGVHRHQLNTRFVAEPPDRLAEVAAWLAANSEPGDVVFHAHWDNFGPLFARNRLNRYLGGMDPIFQYAHDPGLYWEYFFLSADATTEYTCDAFPCYEGEATATWSAIRHHFGARWVVVEPARNPKLTRFLEDQELFRPVLRTQREIVFEVVIPDYPPPPTAPGVGPS